MCPGALDPVVFFDDSGVVKRSVVVPKEVLEV
jgi:hypothetical protein